MTQFAAVTGDLHKYEFSRDLSRKEYFFRNLSVGLVGEAAMRHFNLVTCGPSADDSCVDYLSLPKVNVFDWIPAVKAKEVEDAVKNPTKVVEAAAINKAPATTEAAESIAPVTTEVASDSPPVQAAPNGTPDLAHDASGAPETESQSWWSWANEQGTNLKDRVSHHQYAQSATSYVSENKEWLAVTASFTTIYSLSNCLLANRLRNSYARNMVSMGIGVGATLAGAYVMDSTFNTGFQLNSMKVAELGVRVMGYHGVLKLAAPVIYKTLGLGATVVSFAAKPLAFPQTKSKTA